LTTRKDNPCGEISLCACGKKRPLDTISRGPISPECIQQAKQIAEELIGWCESNPIEEIATKFDGFVDTVFSKANNFGFLAKVQCKRLTEVHA
jgi:hypothetical protein